MAQMSIRQRVTDDRGSVEAVTGIALAVDIDHIRLIDPGADRVV